MARKFIGLLHPFPLSRHRFSPWNGGKSTVVGHVHENRGNLCFRNGLVGVINWSSLALSRARASHFWIKVGIGGQNLIIDRIPRTTRGRRSVAWQRKGLKGCQSTASLANGAFGAGSKHHQWWDNPAGGPSKITMGSRGSKDPRLANQVALDNQGFNLRNPRAQTVGR